MRIGWKYDRLLVSELKSRLGQEACTTFFAALLLCGAKAGFDLKRNRSFSVPLAVHRAKGSATMMFVRLTLFVALLAPAASTDCSTGKYSASGMEASGCVECSAGRYAPSAGSTYCSDCPRNQYSNTIGASACPACSTGKIARPGSVACTDPPLAPGKDDTCSRTTISETGVGPQTCCAGFRKSGFTCVACPTGEFAVAASSACSKCAAGTFSATLGSPSCSECAAGTQSNVVGATDSNVCTPCAFGKFSASGVAACLDCVAGQFSGVTGTVTCSLCAAVTAGAAAGT